MGWRQCLLSRSGGLGCLAAVSPAVRRLCLEGFDAVTMKRIAGELDAGTMTLYYYVRNKADIVTLMQDAIFEDVLVPAGEFPSRDAAADNPGLIAEAKTRTLS